MRIGGFQKISLIDYPGKVAVVVFVGGCNFRCPYCYNRDLVVDSERLPTIPEEKILAYLKERKGLVDGVVITGGEPTLQKDLPDFARKIKDLGLLVKLDTNGTNSFILSSMKENGLVDYVALDIKASLDERYLEAVGLDRRKSAHNQRQSAELSQSNLLLSIRKSLEVLQNFGVDFELRTTVVPTLHSEKDLLDLAKQLSKLAPKAKWFLQNFQSKNCLDPEFEKIRPYDNIFFKGLIKKLRVYLPSVELRG